MFVYFREGHFLCVDGCYVPECGFEEKWDFFGQHLVDDCKTLLNKFSLFRRFPDAILFVVKSAEEMCSDLVVQNSFQTDFIVLQWCPHLENSFFAVERN